MYGANGVCVESRSAVLMRILIGLVIDYRRAIYAPFIFSQWLDMTSHPTLTSNPVAPQQIVLAALAGVVKALGDAAPQKVPPRVGAVGGQRCSIPVDRLVIAPGAPQ
ncbi:Uncharacterised protein [Mycobacteroides abscessus subsp. abscessus]|nr:Uncharacterised protein [Mycobacteroides abscessus]SHS31366.1 Uncharacterised protein [Mycobacteroides abscessus subsp. abscessus]SHY12420.1 Uncharacterised protein [Mycobacteroides abscessus subsp. abscessus]SIF64272.1 Uncharacterised protein [Mycobacteroides abscessus subsp. abscessus]SIK10233.1 Uncharacterised protein [Mycobacteroides abscessus subsp. abscessus]